MLAARCPGGGIPPDLGSARGRQDAVVDNRVAAVVIMAAGAAHPNAIVHPESAAPDSRQIDDRAGDRHCGRARPERLVVVVGHQREQVTAHLAEVAPHVTIAVQEQLLGTGTPSAPVWLRCPALPVRWSSRPATSRCSPVRPRGTGRHAPRRGQRGVTVLTSIVPDPTGYGRIVREGDQVSRIVEQKDASAAELDLNEINFGIYVFESDVLGEGIEALEAKNAQGELYLTDVVAYARQAGRRVGAQLLADHL